LFAEEITAALGKRVSKRTKSTAGGLVRIGLDQRYACVTGST
jgi:hypothetical protein